MKKLFLLLAAISLFSSCSKDDNPSSETEYETITNIDQLAGTWKLNAKTNSGSSTNTATACDLQYGKFVFGASVVENRGFSDVSGCSDQSYTYSSASIASGQLVLMRSGTETKYYLKKSGGSLWITKYSTLTSGSPTPVIIPTGSQVTNYYIKQ